MDDHPLRPAALDHAAHLAVVDQHRLAGRQPVEHCRLGAFGLEAGAIGEAARPDQQELVAGAQALAVGREAHGPGPDLGPAQVHQDLEPSPPTALSRTQPGDHPRPDVGIVVGAVDPDRVGTGGDDALHDGGISRRLTRAGHQDAGPPCCRARSEDAVRRAVQERLPLEEGLPVGPGSGRCRSQARESGGDRGEIRPDPALQPAQRREPQRHQLLLERPQVVVAQRQIGGEVGRTVREALPPQMRPPALQVCGRVLGDEALQLVQPLQQILGRCAHVGDHRRSLPRLPA